MEARWCAVVACALVSACSTMTIRISRSELQADLAKRFPRDVDKLVVTVRASAPHIDFPGKPDMLGVRLRVEATSASGRSRVGGTARVEGRLDYVAAEHAFYLRDPEVTELVLAQPQGHGSLARLVGHARGNALVERAARSAIEELLETYPVYRLDARRSAKEAKAIRHLRSARIDGEDLVLEVGL